MKNWIKASLYVLLPIMIMSIFFLAMVLMEIVEYILIGVATFIFLLIIYIIIKDTKKDLDEKDKKTKLES